jgi:hypothetical protein
MLYTKNKKIIFSFLALIVLVVILSFVPIKEAKAQTSGACYGANGQYTGLNQTNCTALASQGYTWKTTTTSTTTTTPTSTTQTYCDYGPNSNGVGEDIEPSDSAAECIQNHGTPTSTVPVDTSSVDLGTIPSTNSSGTSTVTTGTCDYGPDGVTDPNSNTTECTAANGAVGFTPKGSTTEQYFTTTSNPAGTCTYYDNTGTNVESTDTNSTQSECASTGGTFSAGSSSTSSTSNPAGTCTYYDNTGTNVESTDTNSTQSECASTGGTFSASSAAAATNNTAFKDMLNKYFVCDSISNCTVEGFFVRVLYFLLMLIPSFVLWLSAYFFNVFAAIGLSSKLFAGSTFIPTAWAVVRDLSNVFFILVLLYIAIRLIVGIGGHDTKKMIARVIIMALLINFSMFFTEVVIDASNILALVFYNKVTVGTKNASGQIVATPYDSVTGEKDMAGGLTGAFNPANQLTPDFFNSAASINNIPGTTTGDNTPGSTTVPGAPSLGIVFGIMLLSGGIMLVAAYAFFISGFSFLGRLIELFVLIIFSPFALMSFSIPKLA